MGKEKIREQLRQYCPWNEQEERDREVILRCLESMPDVFFRTSLTAHMSASAWVVNTTFDKALMAYHKLYDSWAWLGGHADGQEDLLAVALKEVREESGIRVVEPVTEDIFSLEVLTVDGHEKRGVYVPSHLHLNVTYLLKADESQELRAKEDENSGVAWFGIGQAVEASAEPWIRRRVYGKLIEKMNEKLGSAARH